MRQKTVKIDGQDIIICSLSKKDSDEIEADHRTRYWLSKKMEMLDIISESMSEEQLRWAKAEYDLSAMNFNDAISKSGFDTIKKMLRLNDFVNEDWLNEDNDRYTEIERAVASFRSGNVPIIDRAVDMLVNYCKENATINMTGQNVIDKMNAIIDSIISNEDKKK